MSKPKWACSSCGMYSSRRWSVERHILNLHDGIGNFIPFVDYLVRRSGFYLPKFRPSFVKKNATKTPYLKDWLSNHPSKNNPNSPLFIGLGRRSLGRQGILWINGIGLVPVLPFTRTSAYWIFPVVLKTTSLILRLNIS